MKRIELLSKNVSYYKANLHCHSTVPDGRLTPEEIKNEYKKRGYQVIAYTDHNRYRNHTELNDKEFIAIAAIETDIDRPREGKEEYSTVHTYHLNWYDTKPEEYKEEKRALGRPEQIYGDFGYLNQYIQKMKKLGFLCCYNHPDWSLQDIDEYKGFQGLWGMEIYNHGCEVDSMNGYNPNVYAQMLRSGQNLFCVSTDDNHNVESLNDNLCDSFGGYIMIGTDDFSYQGIMKALEHGNFYSCCAFQGQGEAPRIHEMVIEENQLKVKCSPADRIFLHTIGRNCYRASSQNGNTITEAVFPLKGTEGCIRVQIYDKEGRHTHSNAYFLGDDQIMVE